MKSASMVVKHLERNCMAFLDFGSELGPLSAGKGPLLHARISTKGLARPLLRPLTDCKAGISALECLVISAVRYRFMYGI